MMPLRSARVSARERAGRGGRRAPLGPAQVRVRAGRLCGLRCQFPDVHAQHRVRLARARLAVRKDGRVVALQRRVDERAGAREHVRLRRIGAKDAVEAVATEVLRVAQHDLVVCRRAWREQAAIGGGRATRGPSTPTTTGKSRSRSSSGRTRATTWMVSAAPSIPTGDVRPAGAGNGRPTSNPGLGHPGPVWDARNVPKRESYGKPVAWLAGFGQICTRQVGEALRFRSCARAGPQGAQLLSARGSSGRE